MRVRKNGPGSSSHGHVWPTAGHVLDIPAEDAAELVQIAPHDFSILPDLEDEAVDDGTLVTEPEPKKTVSRGGRRPRVEE